MASDSGMLSAALAYAQRGWRVFPIPPGTKAAVMKGWPQRATTDEDQIREWFAEPANIGIACGPESGLLVIDGDGDQGRDWVARNLSADDAAYTVRTGSGGIHVYFLYPDDGQHYPNSASKLAPGVDVRGRGGYVVAPPSATDKGQYKALTPDAEPSEAPAWLLDRLRAIRDGKGRKAPDAGGHDAGRDVAEGGRNDALTSRAGYLRRSGFGFAGIYAALLDYNAQHCRPPLDDDEVESIALSSLRWQPQADGFPMTDFGNAERLVAMHGDDLRYCHDWEAWLVWDGRRWAEDRTSEITRRAKATVRAMYGEAEHVQDADDRKALIKWAMQSESNNRIRSMIDLARSDDRIAVSSDRLNGDAWLLNVQNGTVDLRTGQRKPHSREDLLTKLAPVDFELDAPASTFDGFLNQIFAGRSDLIRFVQQMAGTFLTGDVSEQKLFFAHGMGANGKSTLINLLLEMLGDYGQQAESDLLIQKKRSGGATPELADLFGARFVASVEVDQGVRLAESLVKQLTGGDAIKARHLYQRGFEFRPTHKILLAANHKPAIKGQDNAIWRRIMLIPFDVSIPEADQDHQLPQKLRDELPGVLAWAVQGCLDWQRGGLKIPDAVRAATDEYRRENDPLADFFEDCCEFDPEAWTPTSDLLEAYGQWTLRNKRDDLDRDTIWARLKAEGCETKSRKRGGQKMRGWQGIRQMPQEADPVQNGRAIAVNC